MEETSSKDKRQLRGTWWRPALPNQRLAGRLTIEPNGSAEIELETSEPREVFEAFKAAFSNPEPKPEVFHGLDQAGTPVTLLGCLRIEGEITTAFKVEKFSVGLAAEGRHYGSIDEIALDEVSVDYAYLQEWLMSPRPELKIEGNGTFIIQAPDSKERLSPIDADSTIVVQSSLGSRFNREGIHFSARDQMEFRFTEARSFDQICRLIGDFQWLLTLAVGSPAPVTMVIGFNKEWQQPDRNAPRPIKLTMRWPGRKSLSRDPHSQEMLFTIASIGGGIGPTLARWQSLRREYDAVMACYFATVFNDRLYETQRFLLLAHALELYHQIRFDGYCEAPERFKARVERLVAAVQAEDAGWLRDRLAGANRKTLAVRLRELATPHHHLLGDLMPDLDGFVQSVKNTRNYHTHFDESVRKAGRVAEGDDLLAITHTMRTLLEILFLKDLGLSPSSAINRARFGRSRAVSLFG